MSPIPRIKSMFRIIFFNQTAAKTSAVVTGSGENKNKIEVTIAYDGMTGNKHTVVKSARLRPPLSSEGQLELTTGTLLQPP